MEMETTTKKNKKGEKKLALRGAVEREEVMRKQDRREEEMKEKDPDANRLAAAAIS